MRENPSKADEQETERRRDDAPQDEPGAEQRFNQGLRRALAMPPKPHKEKAIADLEFGPQSEAFFRSGAG